MAIIACRRCAYGLASESSSVVGSNVGSDSGVFETICHSVSPAFCQALGADSARNCRVMPRESSSENENAAVKSNLLRHGRVSGFSAGVTWFGTFKCDPLSSGVGSRENARENAVRSVRNVSREEDGGGVGSAGITRICFNRCTLGSGASMQVSQALPLS